MNLKILFVLAYVVGIITLGFCFAFEWIYYGQTGDKKYNFFRNFPYELNQFKIDHKKSYVLLVVELFGCACFIGASLAFAIENMNTNPTSAFIFLAVSSLSIIWFVVLRFVKLTNYKAHLISVSIYVVLNLLLLLLYYFYFTNPDYQYIFSTGVRIGEIIIILILILFEFFLMINPTYKNWYKMVKIEAEVYSRPKYCYLPILEWGNFLIYILSFIAPLLVLFF